MIDSQGQGTQTVTPRFLLRSAAAMGRCARELAALGPPPSLMRQRYQMARQACAAFARAAKLNVAAAHVMSTAGGNDPRLSNLFHQGDTDVNQGFTLISNATFQVPSQP